MVTVNRKNCQNFCHFKNTFSQLVLTFLSLRTGSHKKFSRPLITMQDWPNFNNEMLYQNKVNCYLVLKKIPFPYSPVPQRYNPIFKISLFCTAWAPRFLFDSNIRLLNCIHINRKTNILLFLVLIVRLDYVHDEIDPLYRFMHVVGPTWSNKCVDLLLILLVFSNPRWPEWKVKTIESQGGGGVLGKFFLGMCRWLLRTPAPL